MSSRLRYALYLYAIAHLVIVEAAWGEARPNESFHPGGGPRIVNGVDTQEHATAGALLAGGYQICSGTLIGCETFLTAAHCVEGGGQFQVYLQHAGIFDVAEVHAHPDYSFPVADVAVLKLASPVFGVRPTPINRTDPAPFIPEGGRLVGFGVTSGFDSDGGIKRTGLVTTTHCSPSSGATNEELVCWNFDENVGAPGEDSNTCFGDSGGPLFMDLGTGVVVAGITSGGSNGTCLGLDHSYDANVATYSDWIESVAGSDIDNRSCGGPDVGDSDVIVTEESEVFDSQTDSMSFSYPVPAGTQQLRFALNGVDDGIADFDLLVRYGDVPTDTEFDCAEADFGQFHYCEFDSPAAGEWFVEIQRYSGVGQFQLTITAIGGTPGLCGNGVRDLGEQCDGADARSCAGPCTSACECQEEIDDFLCYKSRRTRGSPYVPPHQAHMSDEIESGDFRIRESRLVCLPGGIDGESVDDPNTQLIMHDNRGVNVKGSARQSNLRIRNRFGSFFIDTVRRDRMLLPTAMDMSFPTTEPDSGGHLLDAYKCYKTRMSRGNPIFPRRIEVDVDEAFENRRYKVRAPSRLCLPADLDFEGMKGSVPAITCHGVRRASRQPAHDRQLGVHFANRTGSFQMDTQREAELCVAADLGYGAADECSDAFAVDRYPYVQSADMSNTTVGANDPESSCGFQGSTTGSSSWYSFTASQSGIVIVDTAGSDFDTVLTAYTGGCGSPVEVACNDDWYDSSTDQGHFQARAEVLVEAGVTYLLKVAAYAGEVPGKLEIDFRFVERPENDSCSGASLVDTFPFSETIDTGGAQFEDSDPFPSCGDGGRSVYYDVQAPADGQLIIDTLGSNYDTVLSVYSGGCSDLSEVTCNDQYNSDQSRVQFPVLGGEIYTVMITDWAFEDGGRLELNVDYSPCGNGQIDAGEQCDFGNDGACPGACTNACACAPDPSSFDVCSVPLEIPSFPFADTQDAAGSTIGLGELESSCAPSAESVWYSLTATNPGLVTIDTIGSDYDTVVSVFDGACDGGSELACSDDTSGGVQSKVEFPVEVGQQYLVKIAAYEGASPGQLQINGQIDLCGNAQLDAGESCDIGNDSACPGACNEQCACAVGGDSCTGAVGLTDFPFSETHDVENMTDSYDDPELSCLQSYPNGNNTVWYSFTAPDTGQLTVNTTGNSFQPMWAVHTGSCGDTLEVACETQSGYVDVEAGETYLLELGSSFPDDSGSVDLDVNFRPCGNGALDAGEECDGSFDAACPGRCSDVCACLPPLAPDTCAESLDVGALPATIIHDPSEATTNEGEPALTCTSASSSVWYSVTAPADGHLIVDTFGSNYDTVLGASTGSCGGASEVSCNDDKSSLQSEVRFPVASGEAYLIEVASYGSSAPGSLLQLNVEYDPCGNDVLDGGEVCDGSADANCPGRCTNTCECLPPLSPDECSGAVDVGALPATLVHDPSEGTTNDGEPSLTCESSSHSVWYSVTAPADGFITADTFGSSYDTVLAAHDGECGGGSEVACNDQAFGNQSQIRFPVQGGESYRIEVASYLDHPNGTQLQLNLNYDSCGNDVADNGEECDGGDDSACPGQCMSNCACTPPPPANDQCSSPTPITELPALITEDVSAALTNEDEPALSCAPAAGSVWYSVVAPSDGRFFISTADSGYDTVLAAHSGTCGALEQVSCLDDTLGGAQAAITFAAVGGETYLIEVADYGDVINSNTLNLSVVFEPPE